MYIYTRAFKYFQAPATTTSHLLTMSTTTSYVFAHHVNLHVLFAHHVILIKWHAANTRLFVIRIVIA